jgi:O-acetylserine/cysteine efflux transporter
VTKIDILIAIVINAIWGTAYAFSKYAMKVFPPVLLFSVRFIICGVSALPFNLPKKRIDKKQLFYLFLFSLITSVTFFTSSIGASKLDTAVANVVDKMDIPITIILGVSFLGEKLRLKTVLGIILCFLAVYITSGNVEVENLKYIWLMFAGCFFTSVASIFSKRIKVNNKIKVCWSSIVVGFVLLILSKLMGEEINHGMLDFKVVLSLIFLAMVCGYLCYVGLYYLLEKYNTSMVMPYKFLSPIVSVIAGLVILGEAITKEKVFSIVLIIIGVGISQYSFKRQIVVNTRIPQKVN